MMAAAANLDEATVKNVKSQVEFYFSDSNLPKDKFLMSTVEASEDGLVSLPLICSFKRMRSHLGLGDDFTAETIPEATVLAVAEVLRQSSSLRVSDDGKKIGRVNKLLKPEEIIDQVDSRTVAASPFPYNVQQEDVQSFFAQYAKVNSVRLPRHVTDKRFFCGTALVEFSEEEDVNNIPKKNLSYAGAELEFKLKKDFDAERQRQIEQHEKNRTDKDKDPYPKGLILSFKLKSKSGVSIEATNGTDAVEVSGTEKEETPFATGKLGEEENIENPNEKASDNVGTVDESGTEKEACVAADELGEKPDVDIENQNAIALDKTGEEAGSKAEETLEQNREDVLTREDLKAAFQKFGVVRYVDFRIGDTSGYVRFNDPKESEKARAFTAFADEGGLTVKNYIVIVDALAGEPERDYWKQLRENQDMTREASKNFRGGRGRGNNRGGRNFNGKRNWRDSSEGGSKKAQKLDA